MVDREVDDRVVVDREVVDREVTETELVGGGETRELPGWERDRRKMDSRFMVESFEGQENDETNCSRSLAKSYCYSTINCMQQTSLLRLSPVK